MAPEAVQVLWRHTTSNQSSKRTGTSNGDGLLRARTARDDSVLPVSHRLLSILAVLRAALSANSSHRKHELTFTVLVYLFVDCDCRNRLGDLKIVGD